MPAIAVAALIAAGCGGGSASSPAASGGGGASTTAAASTQTAATQESVAGGSGRLTREELIARADAICAKVNSELAKSKPAKATAQEVLRVVPTIAASERSGIRELSRLTPPRSLERQWRRILEYRRSLADQLSTLVHDTKSSDQAGVNALGGSKLRLHRALQATAKSAGFKVCGDVGAPTPPK